MQEHSCYTPLHLDALHEQGVSVPAIQLPTTAEEAYPIHSHQLADTVISNGDSALKTPIAQATSTVEDILEADNIYVEGKDRMEADPEYDNNKDSVATDMSEDSNDDGAGVFKLLSLRGSMKAGIED